MNMKMISAIGAAAALLSAVVSASALADGDAAAGRGKVATCQGCHGIPGYKTAFPAVYNVPKLGGQQAAYIVKALQGYKSGERSHPTMRAIAAGLSDKDMADIAAYYGAEDSKMAGK